MSSSVPRINVRWAAAVHQSMPCAAATSDKGRGQGGAGEHSRAAADSCGGRPSSVRRPANRELTSLPCTSPPMRPWLASATPPFRCGSLRAPPTEACTREDACCWVHTLIILPGASEDSWIRAFLLRARQSATNTTVPQGKAAVVVGTGSPAAASPHAYRRRTPRFAVRESPSRSGESDRGWSSARAKKVATVHESLHWHNLTPCVTAPRPQRQHSRMCFSIHATTVVARRRWHVRPPAPWRPRQPQTQTCAQAYRRRRIERAQRRALLQNAVQ